MYYLLLRIVFTVSFSHLLRFSQARTRRPMAAAAVNYALAALACAGWAGAARVEPTLFTGVLGVLGGITYVTTLVVMFPAMKRSGVSVAGAVNQLALMLPVAFAIIRFGERPGLSQSIGIALTLVALPLLGMTTAVKAEIPRRFSFLIVLLFLAGGTSQVIMKEYTAARHGVDISFFSAVLFSTATVLTLLWAAITGDTGGVRNLASSDGSRPPVSFWPAGIALGAVNVLQLVCLLLALEALPAVVVFPISACLGILANALASMVLWKERPPPMGWLGLGLAAIAVALLGLAPAHHS